MINSIGEAAGVGVGLGLGLGDGEGLGDAAVTLKFNGFDMLPFGYGFRTLTENLPAARRAIHSWQWR